MIGKARLLESDDRQASFDSVMTHVILLTLERVLIGGKPMELYSQVCAQKGVSEKQAGSWRDLVLNVFIKQFLQLACDYAKDGVPEHKTSDGKYMALRENAQRVAKSVKGLDWREICRIGMEKVCKFAAKEREGLPEKGNADVLIVLIVLISIAYEKGLHQSDHPCKLGFVLLKNFRSNAARKF